MRRFVVVLAPVLLLIAALGPTVEAGGGGTTVSGTWTWTNTGATVMDVAGGGQVHNGTETSLWTGGFAGRSTDMYQLIQTSPSASPFGPSYGTQTNVFTGKVGGHRGSMIMYVTFWSPAGDTRNYSGNWLISIRHRWADEPDGERHLGGRRWRRDVHGHDQLGPVTTRS